MALRIVTWNVRSLRDDRSEVVAVVRSLQPDVLALQEVPRFLRHRSKLAALARDTGLLATCGGRASAGTALLTALRMDVLRSSESLLPKTPRLHQRGAAIAELRLSGADSPSLVVASIHLGLNGGERRLHAQYLAELIAAYGVQDTVVAGDLNDFAGSPAWQILEHERVDAGAAANAPTFPARAPTARIDAVFMPQAWSVTCRTISASEWPEIARATDHCPVVVDVSLPGH